MTDEETLLAARAAYEAKKIDVLPQIGPKIEAAVLAVLRSIVVDHSTLIGALEVTAREPRWNRDTQTSANATWDIRVKFRAKGAPG